MTKKIYLETCPDIEMTKKIYLEKCPGSLHFPLLSVM